MNYRRAGIEWATKVGLGEVSLADAAYVLQAQLVALRIRTASLGFFRRYVIRHAIDRVIDLLGEYSAAQSGVSEE